MFLTARKNYINK